MRQKTHSPLFCLSPMFMELRCARTPTLALWAGAPLAEGPVCVLRWGYSIRFGLAWDLTTKTLFLFLPFGTRMSHRCLPRHCVLEARSLPGFTDLQLEFFSLRVSRTSGYTISDIEAIYMRSWTLDFRVDVGMSQDFGGC